MIKLIRKNTLGVSSFFSFSVISIDFFLGKIAEIFFSSMLILPELDFFKSGLLSSSKSITRILLSLEFFFRTWALLSLLMMSSTPTPEFISVCFDEKEEFPVNSELKIPGIKIILAQRILKNLMHVTENKDKSSRDSCRKINFLLNNEYKIIQNTSLMGFFPNHIAVLVVFLMRTVALDQTQHVKFLLGLLLLTEYRLSDANFRFADGRLGLDDRRHSGLCIGVVARMVVVRLDFWGLIGVVLGWRRVVVVVVGVGASTFGFFSSLVVSLLFLDFSSTAHQCDVTFDRFPWKTGIMEGKFFYSLGSQGRGSEVKYSWASACLALSLLSGSRASNLSRKSKVTLSMLRVND